MTEENEYSGHKTYYSKKWRDTDSQKSNSETVDNIYNYDWIEIIEKYPIIQMMMDEQEFNERKSAYIKKNTV